MGVALPLKDSPLWDAARRVAPLFALYRGAFFLFTYIGLQLTEPRRNNHNKDYEAFPNHPWLDGFFRWDSGWYQRIAERGYFIEGRQSDVVFFPLYPYLSRALGWLFGDYFIAGFIVSNVALFVGLVFVHAIAKQLRDDAIASRTVLFLLVFPTTIFFSAFYTESLFLALTAGSLYFFSRQNYWAAGVLGALASATRLQGVLLLAAFGIALAWQLWRERTWRWQWLWLLLVPAGLVAFMTLLQHSVGDAWAFLTYQKHWARQVAFPLVSLWRALANVDGSFARDKENMQLVMDIAMSVGFVTLAIVAWRKRYPVVLVAWALFGVLVPLCGGVMSMGRFCLVIFPAFIVLAELCEKPARERFALTTQVFFMATYSLLFMNWFWAG